MSSNRLQTKKYKKIPQFPRPNEPTNFNLTCDRLNLGTGRPAILIHRAALHRGLQLLRAVQNQGAAALAAAKAVGAAVEGEAPAVQPQEATWEAGALGAILDHKVLIYL